MASPPAAGNPPPDPQELVREEFINQIAILGELMMSGRRPSAAPATPAFPRYLLPSLRIPFRRRRRSSESPQSASSSSSSPTTSEPPSLSTSPTSPVSFRRLSRAHPTTLRCRACSTDLAFHSQIISKCFFGRHGRAYLLAPPSTMASPTSPGTTGSSASSSRASPLSEFGTIPHRRNSSTATSSTTTETDTETPDLVNTKLGRPEDRQLATGLHIVADVKCATCHATVGWKYLDANSPPQKYKVGKFILETNKVVGFHSWEDVDVPCTVDEGNHGGGRGWGWGASGGDADGEGVGDEEGEDGVVVFDSEDEDECDDIFAGVWDAKVVAKRRRSKAENIRMGGEYEDC